MADASSVEPQLNFEQTYNPHRSHTNWFWEKMQDFTMKREAAIKGETMNYNIEYQLVVPILQAALASEARFLINDIQSIGMGTFARQAGEIIRTQPLTLITPFIDSVATGVFFKNVISSEIEKAKLRSIKKQFNTPTPRLSKSLKEIGTNIPKR